MERVGVDALIAKAQAERVAKAEARRLPGFSEAVRSHVATYLRMHAVGIPPQKQYHEELHEGTHGILPAPAKRLAVKDALAGRPTVPLKVFEETVETEQAEKLVDAFTMHVVVEVSPASPARFAETHIAIAAITDIGRTIEDLQRNQLVTAGDEDLSIRIKKARAVVHLLVRNAVGQYTLEEFEMGSGEQRRQVIEKYQEALVSVGQFDPSKSPGDDVVSHEVAFRELALRIQQDRGVSKVSMPVIVCPQRYQYVHSEKYMGLVNELKVLAGVSDPDTVIIEKFGGWRLKNFDVLVGTEPVMVFESGQNPILARCEQGTEFFRPIPETQT